MYVISSPSFVCAFRARRAGAVVLVISTFPPRFSELYYFLSLINFSHLSVIRSSVLARMAKFRWTHKKTKVPKPVPRISAPRLEQKAQEAQKAQKSLKPV